MLKIINSFFLLAKLQELYPTRLQTSPLYGNSTDLEYYYVIVYVGSKRHPQALIVDTGSSVAAIPCAEYRTAKSCGTHLNPIYRSNESTTHELIPCDAKKCHCVEGDKC